MHKPLNTLFERLFITKPFTEPFVDQEDLSGHVTTGPDHVQPQATSTYLNYIQRDQTHAKQARHTQTQEGCDATKRRLLATARGFASNAYSS